jgi:hypothetical protein
MARFQCREQRQGNYEAIILRLYVDGVLLRDSEVIELRNGEKHLRVTLPESTQSIMRLPLQELEEEFAQITLPINPPICELVNWVTVRWRSSERNDFAQQAVIFAISVDYLNWARPWTIAALANTLRQVTEWDQDLTSYEGKKYPAHEFGILAPFVSGTNNLDELISLWLPRIESTISATLATLSTASRDSLVTYFDFPPSIRAACQQYVIYFVQFLSDLGIDADAELKEIARRVLFSVTPREGPDALVRIQEALDLYLHLPDSSEFILQASAYPDVAVRQLTSNISHLENQWATALLDAKDAQINALRLSNFVYQQVFANAQQITVAPISRKIEANTDTETVIPDILELGKFEAGGVILSAGPDFSGY